MKTTNNTVLISGGSAGIGFEIAKLLSEKGNHVIITGRNEERLKQAAAKLKNVSAIVSDVSNPEDVERLVKQINNDFPQLNILINNAGRALIYDITAENINAYEKAEDEMLTNYLSVIRLNEKLLPLLKKQASATIVNVSSVVAFVPGSLVTYSASKAALHSYTQSLRLALEQETKIKVFELMPPLVDTELSAPIGGKNGISPTVVAEQFVAGLEQNEFEIRVGQTEDMYRLYLSSPEEAFQLMNQTRVQEMTS
nr:SDR family NAD(P)-dependent oxidoreductase [uncultured Flavobacterium sp.]